MIRIPLLAVALLAAALNPVWAEDEAVTPEKKADVPEKKADVPEKKAALAIGEAGAAFELRAPDGSMLSLKALLAAEGTKAVIVEIAGANCPFSRAAEKAVTELVASYGEKGLAAVALFPNRTDIDHVIRRYGKLVESSRPMAMDPGARVTAALGAEVTPTFFVFDAAGVLRFRGAVADLRAAVEAVLAGKTVERADTPVVGCAIRPGEKTDGADSPDGKVPPLSPEAATWLGQLLEKLGAEDPAIARSIIHGIQAMGPAALPYLLRWREGKTGLGAQRCERIIREIRHPTDSSSRNGRRSVTRLTMLETQLRALESLIELSPEQKKELRLRFVELRQEEDVIRADLQRGKREKIAERRKALVQKSQVIVREVLTDEQWQKWESLRGPGRGKEKVR